eukprot:TRINITY_DN11198_c0_g1_i1.p1 TRINITY_DN11198_c0_g1~~TRINITY_DN11198_c0_g1_i1.p1  ORF type:complete len:275 (-),score=26.84 TRINITY_DN11198_c0_g1_i1:29-811(-)
MEDFLTNYFKGIDQMFASPGMKYHPQYNQYVSWPFMLSVSGLYLVAIFVIRQFMASRKAVSPPKWVMTIYNACQVSLSLYMAVGLLGNGKSIPNIFGINSKFTANLEYFVYVHYWSKAFDFIDTLLILLKKDDSRLSFLHIYHHSSILVVWGFLLHYGVANGTTSFGCGINSVIHAIMYGHYLITSLGFQNPLKKWVTKAQLFQFFTCLAHSVVAMFFEESIIKYFAPIQLAYQTSMIVLFMNFYNTRYDKSKVTKPKTK